MHYFACYIKTVACFTKFGQIDMHSHTDVYLTACD